VTPLMLEKVELSKQEIALLVAYLLNQSKAESTDGKRFSRGGSEAKSLESFDYSRLLFKLASFLQTSDCSPTTIALTNPLE